MEVHDRLAYAKWEFLVSITEKTRDFLASCLSISECSQNVIRDQGDCESQCLETDTAVLPVPADSYSLCWEQWPWADSGNVVLVVDEGRWGDTFSLQSVIIASLTWLWQTLSQMSNDTSVVFWCFVQDHPLHPSSQPSSLGSPLGERSMS